MGAAYILASTWFLVDAVWHLGTILLSKVQRRPMPKIRGMLLRFFVGWVALIAFVVFAAMSGVSRWLDPNVSIVILSTTFVLPAVAFLTLVHIGKRGSPSAGRDYSFRLVICVLMMPMAAIAVQFMLLEIFQTGGPDLLMINPPTWFSWIEKPNICAAIFWQGDKEGFSDAPYATSMFWIDATIQSLLLDVPSYYGCNFSRLSYNNSVLGFTTLYAVYRVTFSISVVALVGAEVRHLWRRPYPNQPPIQ